jgi:hypothetical protein
MPKTLLVSKNRELSARRIVEATMITAVTGTGTRQTEGRNPLQGAFQVLASPFLDVIDANDWYLGDFQRQFIWKEIWPVQVFRQTRDGDADFDRDVVARYKVRYYGGINALDERFVVKVDGE